MPCEPFRLGDGSVAIVCSRGRRRTKCAVCKTRDATKQCDFPLAGSKTGKTCDRYLCDGCAVQLGDVTRLESDPRWTSPQLRTTAAPDTVDYCPAHAAMVPCSKQCAWGALDPLGRPRCGARCSKANAHRDPCFCAEHDPYGAKAPNPKPPKPQAQLPLDSDFIPPTKGPRTR